MSVNTLMAWTGIMESHLDDSGHPWVMVIPRSNLVS